MSWFGTTRQIFLLIGIKLIWSQLGYESPGAVLARPRGLWKAMIYVMVHLSTEWRGHFIITRAEVLASEVVAEGCTLPDNLLGLTYGRGLT